MKWNRKHLPQSRAQLDEFVRDNKLRPYGVISYKGRDIFIAETDLEHDRMWEPGYELGYYQTAWFVTAPHSMEKLDGGSWVDFAALHDLDTDWTPEAKRSARINETLKVARRWIDKSQEVGRYDA